MLTVADINATNPTLGTPGAPACSGSTETAPPRRGLENPVDREEQIRQTQTAALDQLVRNGIDQDDAESGATGDDYFLRHTAGDVAWHTEAILQHPDDGTPLVLIKETTQREFESGSQIFIYAADQHDFSRSPWPPWTTQPEHPGRGSSPPPASSPSIPISCSTPTATPSATTRSASPRSARGLSTR